MAAVRFDAMLREFGPRGELSTGAANVSALLDELEARYPKLRFRLRDETGSIREFVRVFVNGSALDRAAAPSTALAADDEVEILHSIQGG
ncbi:MAG TPA: MoaD/ThiS family protein [Thermoplasmata archaeon]|nr:MoaD/ThiS family protein [Thermoplasmata archaeon]